MWIAFDELPGTARIWVYQADRALDENLAQKISVEMKGFIESWEAHGKPLKGSAKVLHERFVVIGLDESFNAVTGCSTDASVHAIQVIGDALNIDFFDRTKIAFLVDERIEIVPLEKVRAKEVPSLVTTETLTFNNLVQSKHDLSNAWKQPVKNTWLSRYLN